jgi:eukaryotic-like serine/threonine-protein kinase
VPLTPGTRVGQYEVAGLLGVGGMGEVYRARDLRLEREVALKLVPEVYARHPDYVARFEREARLLAAISHPNVAGIYGVEDAGGARALVLELVEGVPLDELIADASRQGVTLPLDRTVDIARQIALGLEAVHDKGIVHRDLKPANIKVSPDGIVKVLDFGLGRASDPISSDATAAAPTGAVTLAGTVLGTAAYMSPEQARGSGVDRRADVWAFGCVLFELLTGSRAFEGDTWSDTLVRVMGGEPDWSRLPAHTPPALRRVLRRCLEKDARRRLHDIADARLDLEDAGSEPADSNGRGAVGHAVDVRVERLTDAVGIAGAPALSPDGKMVAFVAVANGRRQLWIRMIAGGAPLQITRADADHDAPRWTPDSAAIIYYSAAPNGANGHLWRVSTLGGTPRRIAPATGGCDVSHDGRRLAFFQATDGGVALVTTALDGSSPTTLLALNAEFRYDGPRWSPDDREIAFNQTGTLFVARLDVVTIHGLARRTLATSGWLRGHAWLPDGSAIVYSSSTGSTLAYPPTNNLRIVGADGRRDRQLTFGDLSYTEPDIRESGRLLASRVRGRSDIWRFPIDGSPADNVRSAVRITHQTGQIQVPALSPDGRTLVYVSDSGGHSNLWMAAEDGSGATQLTFERDDEITVGMPMWTPTADRILFVRGRRGGLDICAIAPDGSGFTTLVAQAFSPGCSPDGRWLYFSRPDVQLAKLELATGTIVPVRPNATGAAGGGSDTLYFTRTVEPHLASRSDNEVCRARVDDGPAEPLVRIPAARVPLAPRLWVHSTLSPDGRWLAAPLLDSTTANLWLIPTDGSPLRAVTDFGDRSVFMARSTSWSPDSRFLYVAVADVDADIVMVEGLIA